MTNTVNAHIGAHTTFQPIIFPPGEDRNWPFVLVKLGGRPGYFLDLIFRDVSDIERLVAVLQDAGNQLAPLHHAANAAKGYPFRLCHGIHPSYSGQCEHCQPPSPQDLAGDVSADLPGPDAVPAATCDCGQPVRAPGTLWCEACYAKLDKQIPF